MAADVLGIPVNEGSNNEMLSMAGQSLRLAENDLLRFPGS